MSIFKGLYSSGKNKLFGDYQLPEVAPTPTFSRPWDQPTPDLNANMPPVLAPDAKPSAWGQGGKAWQILGVIGDALATAGGGQPIYLPQVLDLQQRTDAERRQLAMYKQKREDEWTDFQREHQWQIDHPKPVNNDTTNDYAFIAEKLGPEVANQYLRNLGDPMTTVPLGNGQFYSGPRSGLGDALGRTGQSLTQPVGKLTIIPGGGAGNGTGGFRKVP